MIWLYEHLLRPFLQVATISTAIWLAGQWMGFVAPEITQRFRGISMAIMRAIIPPKRKWYKTPSILVALAAATTILVITAVKRRK